jgi:hypothetical protein
MRRSLPLPGHPLDRGPAFEVTIKTDSHPLPLSLPIKHWSQGELDECHMQVAFLIDQGWIVPLSCPNGSLTWHGASVRTTVGWMPSQRLVEPLSHVDLLIDASFFTKMDLVMACMKFRIR